MVEAKGASSAGNTFIATSRSIMVSWALYTLPCRADPDFFWAASVPEVYQLRPIRTISASQQFRSAAQAVDGSGCAARQSIAFVR